MNGRFTKDELLEIRNKSDIRTNKQNDVNRIVFERDLMGGSDTRARESNIDTNEKISVRDSFVEFAPNSHPLKMENVKNGILRLNNVIFSEVFYNFQENFIVDGIGLYSIFATIFMTAESITQVELRKVFSFPKHETLCKELDEIVEELDDTKNIMLLSTDVPYNKDKYDDISNYCGIIIVDSSEDVDTEAHRINKHIYSMFEGKKIRKFIVADNLINLQLLFLNISYINPIIKINKKAKGEFNGKSGKKIVEYGIIENCILNFYEDKKKRIIEFPFGNLVYGIALGNVEISELYQVIPKLKKMAFEMVRIPLFRHEFKYRYTSILKKLDLNSVFDKITSSFFPQSVQLHDVLQNITVEIGYTKMDSQCDISSGKLFVCSVPFLYYIRTQKTEVITMIGMFG